jgi:hypothetical protein
VRDGAPDILRISERWTSWGGQCGPSEPSRKYSSTATHTVKGMLDLYFRYTFIFHSPPPQVVGSGKKWKNIARDHTVDVLVGGEESLPSN